MDEAELREVDSALREMCDRDDLRWIVPLVDQAILAGYSEYILPGNSSFYERGAFRGFAFEPVSRNTRPVTRSRPFTNQEGVVILIDAMLGVYRDLPLLRRATIDSLRQGWHGRVPMPDRIGIADEAIDEVIDEFGLEVFEEDPLRQQVIAALSRLRIEVLGDDETAS